MNTQSNLPSFFERVANVEDINNVLYYLAPSYKTYYPYELTITDPITSRNASGRKSRSLYIFYRDMSCVLFQERPNIRHAKITYGHLKDTQFDQTGQLGDLPGTFDIIPSTERYIQHYGNIDNYIQLIHTELQQKGCMIPIGEFVETFQASGFPYDGYVWSDLQAEFALIDEIFTSSHAVREEPDADSDADTEVIDLELNTAFIEDDDEGEEPVYREKTNMPLSNIMELYRIMKLGMEQIKFCSSCSRDIDPSELVMNQHCQFSCKNCMCEEGNDILDTATIMIYGDLCSKRLEGLTDCPICANPVNESNLWMTKCGHLFCDGCIDRIDNCSICRMPCYC